MTEKIEISARQLNLFLLKKQNLFETIDISIPELVERCGGLHATASTTPYLSLFARLPSFCREQLDDEMYVNKTIGRIRCVRMTMYIQPACMFPALYEATYRKSLNVVTRQMERQGIIVGDYDRIAGRILKIVKNNPMTASQMKSYMGAPQPLSGLLNRMCELGLLARAKPAGSWKSQAYHYARFDEYYPDIDLRSTSENEARIEVVRYYLTAFAPLKMEDIVWWTDFGKAQVRTCLRKLEDRLVRVEVPGLSADYIMLKQDLTLLGGTTLDSPPVVTLLPMLDPYLMAYRDRSRYLSEVFYNHVYDSTGNAAATILVDGRIAGIWDVQACEDDDPLVKLFFFEMLSDPVLDAVYAEAERMGAFILGQRPALRTYRDMVPLDRQTAGAFASPLKEC